MKRSISTVLLAAGYGTRLYPVTRDCPKALLPVGSQTILDLVIDNLRSVPGLAQSVLVTNEKFFDQFTAWQARQGNGIAVISDGSADPDARLGAIRDLQLALERIDPADDVLVLGTDNLFAWPLAGFVAYAAGKRPAASVAVRRAATHEEARRCGVIELGAEGRIIRLIEKPAQPPCLTIALCIYYLPAPCRERVGEFIRAGGTLDAPGYFLEWLALREPAYGCMTTGDWFDIGTPESYERAVAAWAARAREKEADV